MEKPLAFTQDRVRAVRTPANYRIGQLKTDFEKVDPVSVTIPDQSLSLGELLDRYSKGQYVRTRKGVYLGEEDVPDIEKLDYFERIELKEQNAEHIRGLRSDLQKAESTKRKKVAEQNAQSSASKGTGPVPSPE